MLLRALRFFNLSAIFGFCYGMGVMICLAHWVLGVVALTCQTEIRGYNLGRLPTFRPGFVPVSSRGGLGLNCTSCVSTVWLGGI
jgi:hypothetical protein